MRPDVERDGAEEEAGAGLRSSGGAAAGVQGRISCMSDAREPEYWSGPPSGDFRARACSERERGGRRTGKSAARTMQRPVVDSLQGGGRARVSAVNVCLTVHPIPLSSGGNHLKFYPSL